MIRTVVAAASPVARAGLSAALRGDERLDVVGEGTPADLPSLVARLDPDVAVEQRDGGGEAARVPTVALVDDPRAAWLADATLGERGPYALLARDAAPDELVAAVIAVAAGLVAVQPRALGTPAAVSTDTAERLSPREIDVLGELARGVPNKAIAARLGISEHTVKFHIASIFAKLGVSSRTEAVTRGMRLGLVML